VAIFIGNTDLLVMRWAIKKGQASFAFRTLVGDGS